MFCAARGYGGSLGTVIVVVPSAVLRVATFNLRNGRAWDGCNSWPFRRRAALHAVSDLDADLLGLQEVFGFQLRWLGRQLPCYRAVGEARGLGGRGERVPVLIRRDAVRVIEHRTRWFGPTPDVAGSRLADATFPRVATIASVLWRGQRVQFTNTHLDERSAERRRASARQLLGWLDHTVAQVLVGDFNAGPGDALFDELGAAGFRDALPADAGGTFHGFTGGRDGPRIDYILVNRHVAVRDARVVHPEPGKRLPSDHWPVVADLALC